MYNLRSPNVKKRSVKERLDENRKAPYCDTATAAFQLLIARVAFVLSILYFDLSPLLVHKYNELTSPHLSMYKPLMITRSELKLSMH